MDTLTVSALVLFAVAAASVATYLLTRRRQKKKEPDPPRTFENLKEFVEALVKEVDTAIALASLTRAFSEDQRIGPTYDNTYEAHGFVSCRSAVESSLVLCIMRCHDHRPDSHGLMAFFESLKDEATKANLRAGILERRRQWVSEEEAQQDTDEHIAEIDAVRERLGTLRGTHQFAQVRSYRHTKLAHGALQVAPKHVQPVQRDYLYFLTTQTKEIVQSLSSAVLGEGQGFNQWIEIWDDTYTSAFFDTLMERAGG
ncbi:MAG: hypothetical protein QNJ14_04190 [Woeseiaceae bacterium]|nr:hypothetical protein [Woeseiaceae bacterium]